MMNRLITSFFAAFVLSFNVASAAMPDTDKAQLAREYVKNPSGLNSTQGWATYADAAGTAPVDCTGGTAGSTWTTTSTTPLRYSKSFLLTKPASNEQGEGVSYAFSIDKADQAKAITASFDYEISSGTYADNDLSVWIYDVTNSKMIQPSAYLVKNVTGSSGVQKVEFQTASNSTSYRLCLHVGSTSTSTYAVKAAGFSIKPNTYSTGATISDWQSYTPTLTGFGTASNISFFWRRVGSDMHIQGRFTSGTATAVPAQITLPSGAVIASTQAPTLRVFGNAATTENAPRYFTVVGLGGNSHFSIGVSQASVSGSLTTPNVNTFIGAPDSLGLTASIPIQGWGTSQVLASETDTRIVGLSASNPNATAWSNGSLLPFPTVEKDTHGAWNTTTNIYTVPVPGLYRISGSVQSTSASFGNSGNYVAMAVYKNGSHTKTLGTFWTGTSGTSSTPQAGGSTLMDLVAGDQIKFHMLSPSSAALGGAPGNWIAIDRISGPAQVAASEKVLFSANLTANQALTANVTTLKWNNTRKDTHGGWNATTGLYTVPSPGDYRVTEFGILTSGTASLYIAVNGAGYSYLRSADTAFRSATFLIPNLKQGDTISVLSDTTVTMQGSSSTGGPYSGVSIVRENGGGEGGSGMSNGVYSSSSIERIERARLSGTSVSSQSGNWISYASTTGTGDKTYTISPPFSNTPACTCSAVVGGVSQVCNFASITASSVRILTGTDTGAGVDREVSLICMGPR